MSIVGFVVLLTVLAAGGVWLVRTLRAELGALRADAAARLAERSADSDRRLGELAASVDRRLEGIDGRLLTSQQSAGQAATQIVEKLTKLDGTAAQMLARANDLARLEQVLRPPKARGGFGELLLENLLRDRLPPTAFALQHGFAGGERVDAVIKVDRLVPIDSKFPLDNFERMLGAENDIEHQQFEKLFARDVKAHVDAIAGKYIRTDEGTYD